MASSPAQKAAMLRRFLKVIPIIAKRPELIRYRRVTVDGAIIKSLDMASTAETVETTIGQGSQGRRAANLRKAKRING